MSDEILVNVTPKETRAALIENGILQDVMIERSQRRGLVGNIYRGKVARVLPGMQAAFIDIGLEKAGFIHASDICNQEPCRDITELLRQGQEVYVQISKDPIGNKGAKLSAALSLPSRFLVYMPEISDIGVSQKIEDDAERQRLKLALAKIQKEGFADMQGGFIVRTAAEGVAVSELESDVAYLHKLWQKILSESHAQKAPSCLYEDLPLYLRLLRDRVSPSVRKIKVDSRETLQKMQSFCERFLPESDGLLEWYPGERPILELYGVEEDLQKALERRVELKSGGHLIIDQTEAMTTVDVNTGAFVGHRNFEETIFKTNLEAAVALARQLRVRNLGGIIIVDFIDMQDEGHKNEVHNTLAKCLEKDTARTAISGVTELGLVQVIRKRTRESLEQMLCETCPSCQGRGSVKSIETVCYEIFRAILRESRAYNHDEYMILASVEVVERLLDEESSYVADLEQFIGKTLRYQAEPQYMQEQFDIVLL